MSVGTFLYYLDVQRPLPKHCLLIPRQPVYATYYNFIIYTKNIIYAKVNKCMYVYLYSTSICVLFDIYFIDVSTVQSFLFNHFKRNSRRDLGFTQITRSLCLPYTIYQKHN